MTRRPLCAVALSFLVLLTLAPAHGAAGPTGSASAESAIFALTVGPTRSAIGIDRVTATVGSTRSAMA
ncbi:MAG: hypothetical protein ACRDH5_14490, partial [bacterium]